VPTAARIPLLAVKAGGRLKGGVRHMLLLLAALFGALIPAAAPAETADIAAAARSVVRIVLIADEGGQLALIGHGSGVAIGPDLVLTNAHVVAPTQDDETMRIGVVPPEGKDGAFARIVAFSPGNDLALIRLTEHGAMPAATLYIGPVADGADVFAVGYPGNVDVAQGLDIGDLVSPTTPVKTRGNVSAGRSSKQFDTLLHTAPIGAGNSGGPLLDDCGRVIGINSFGTITQDADSAFYFAVSMREVTRFLLNARVKAQTTGAPCRSLAEFSRDQAQRAEAEQQRAEQAALIAAAATDKARRQAQLEVIGARENGMALTGFALLLALGTAGAGVFLLQKQRRREAIVAAVLTVALVGGGVAAWLTRPPLADIDARADAILSKEHKPDGTRAPKAPLAGDLVCVLDSQRSRVTVSSTSDITMNWRADGCRDGRTQFASGPDGWLRVLVPDNDETVTVASFDPATGVYKADRYLLDYDAMTRLRGERARPAPAQCGAGVDAAARMNADQMALKALLPNASNEQLVYNCSQAR
jgi:hypothetical protein